MALTHVSVLGLIPPPPASLDILPATSVIPVAALYRVPLNNWALMELAIVALFRSGDDRELRVVTLLHQLHAVLWCCVGVNRRE